MTAGPLPGGRGEVETRSVAPVSRSCTRTPTILSPSGNGSVGRTSCVMSSKEPAPTQMANAIAMPPIATQFPRLAVMGEFISLSDNMKQIAANR